MDRIYINVKYIFFAIGFILTIYFIYKDGLIHSHTPPLGFVIPFFVFVIGLTWTLIDYIISSYHKKLNLNVNYYGLLLNLMIITLIIFYTILNSN